MTPASKPIEGVSTSTAAFVGLAPGGPVDRPVQISNWSEFARTFSDPTDTEHGPFMAGASLAHAVDGFFANGGQSAWVVRVGHSGVPGRAALTAADGLCSLAAVDAISMVCIPDLMTMATGNPGADSVHLGEVQAAMIEHCERMADRMAILDTPPDLSPSAALDWRLNTAGYDSKQATLYYPWLEVIDPLTGLPLLVPPCGHVAGVWARTDSTRGVHKAPANEGILRVTGLGFQVTDSEQSDLNRSGVNCIRSFPGRGIRVWGARTISSDPEWRYLNVRRLFNYISDSIMQGTQWAAFEPNDEGLWIQLQIAVTDFLTSSWRSGALVGGKPDEAFYVKCDSETNPPELIEAGQVTTEVGIAPVKPAEFVVFRISQYAAGGGAAPQ